MSFTRWFRRTFAPRRYCDECRYFKYQTPSPICTHDKSQEFDPMSLVWRFQGTAYKPYSCSLMRRGACGRAGKLWRRK